jgi:translation initiation factor RLI1
MVHKPKGDEPIKSHDKGDEARFDAKEQSRERLVKDSQSKVGDASTGEMASTKEVTAHRQYMKEHPEKVATEIAQLGDKVNNAVKSRNFIELAELQPQVQKNIKLFSGGITQAQEELARHQQEMDKQFT